MFTYQVNELIDPSDKQIFKEHYELASGLLLPKHYLDASQVFGLIRGKQIIGGFILGSNQPLRTYRVFANEIHWPALHSRLEQLALCEICCLWLERKYWNWLTTSFLWFNAARIVSKRKEDMVVFGTVSKGNMILYASTPHAQLIHYDLVDIRGTKKSSWIYGIPVKWFFIDINWTIAVRFYHHILKALNTSGSKYLKKQLGIR
jgi:hypothetical protein